MSLEITADRNCPQCQSDRVHWSRSRGLERLARFVGVGYFRCRACGIRFRAFRAWGRKQRSLLFTVLGFLVFVAVLWYTLKFTHRGR
jgi:hypothetical protein